MHQVASATGLKVETVLNLGDHKVEEIDHFDTFANGYLWACSGGGESKIPPGARGDIYIFLVRCPILARKQKIILTSPGIGLILFYIQKRKRHPHGVKAGLTYQGALVGRLIAGSSSKINL